MDCEICGYDICLDEIDIEAFSTNGNEIVVRFYCPGCEAMYENKDYLTWSDIECTMYIAQE